MSANVNMSTNELKINNMSNASMANAPANSLKIETKAEDTSKDTQKPIEKATEANKAVKKHVVIYIGSGEFTDGVGNKWHKNDEKTYDESEYETRNDLHFMIKYGEMKHTEVTM